MGKTTNRYQTCISKRGNKQCSSRAVCVGNENGDLDSMNMSAGGLGLRDFKRKGRIKDECE
jgi:hypothetical protein